MALRSGHADACALRIIKNETNPVARAQLYRQGGLISVTSRILVVDLLNDIVPTELVAGLIVLDANRVTAEPTEAFILRMVCVVAQRRRVRGASAAGAKLPRAPADALEQEAATLATHIEIHADGSQPLSHTGLDDPHSIEGQRYLSAIHREHESFETLIRQNASLVIPISTASPVNALLLARRSQRTAVHIPMGTPTIVVDVREFYSPLPSLLHAAGFNVVPRTIAVGDYILHDHLCVERKSLPDLIQSLRSGRLFNQAESMIAHYSYAVLLIEFEMNTSFSLQAIGSLNPDIVVNSINSQLTMLVLTFPRLRIVWSSSPYETASIFTELKRDAAEPDIDRAVAMGQNDSSVEKESIYASHSTALLQSLQGVTLRNYQALANKFKSISDICAASKDDLVSVLGMEAAIKLYEFIRNSSAN
ncbi:DNA repair protein RAD16 [Coemansia sp. S85]|nr:DNA repair protein RAD16 [Coemansia sp. S85]